MQKNIKRMLLTAVALVGVANVTQAAPYEPKIVAKDAKWVLHVDVDALSKTDAWKLIEPKLKNNPEYVKNLANIERIGKVRLPADLHDITIYGPTFGEQEAVVVINANVNKERLTTLVSFNETYSSETVGGQTIHSWDDKGKKMKAGFAKDGRLVIGQSQQTIVDALDTIDGKSEPLKTEVLTPKQKDAGMLLYIAGDQLAQVAKGAVQSPVLQQLQSAWITVTENKTGLKLTSQIIANNERAAEDVKHAIDGVKSAVSFAAQDDPDAALVSDAIIDMTAKNDGKTVDIDWNLPSASITDLLERATGEMSKKTK